jgi:hypothetical protein
LENRSGQVAPCILNTGWASRGQYRYVNNAIGFLLLGQSWSTGCKLDRTTSPPLMMRENENAIKAAPNQEQEPNPKANEHAIHPR